jgi:hypothetical protein
MAASSDLKEPVDYNSSTNGSFPISFNIISVQWAAQPFQKMLGHFAFYNVTAA